jgi:hypothetical protein
VAVALLFATGLAAMLLWARARKWVAVPLLLGAYTIAPAVVALLNGAGLDAALLGTALPPQNPFFLRGAYLAVELVLPLTLVALIAGAVIRWRTRRRSAQLLAAAAVLAAIAVQFGAYDAGSIGLPTILAFEHPTDRRHPCVNPGLETAAPGSSGTSAFGSALGGLGDGLTGGTDAATDKTSAGATLPCREDVASTGAPAPTGGASDAQSPTNPASGPDLASRLSSAREALPAYPLETFMSAHEGTPPQLFAFVRDHIALDAYPGAMRGALGTANSGAGSPADKALLLAEMLRRGGATVRFARATLDASDVAKLVDAARVVPASTALSAPEVAIERLVAAAPEAHRAWLRARLTGTNDDAQVLRATANTIAADVLTKLATAQIELGDDARMRAEAAAGLRDHVWLQLQNGGAWQDLDPSLGNLEPGAHFASARNVTTTDGLPDDLYATIEVRAVATRLKNDVPADSVVASARHQLVDVLTEPTTLSVGPVTDQPLKELGNAANFHVSIHLAAEDVTGDSFALSDPDLGSLLALRMVLTVARPGLPALVYSRSILERRDRDGAIAAEWTDTARAACALNSRFAGVIATGLISPTFVLGHDLDELIDLQSARGSRAAPTGAGKDARYPYAAMRVLHRAQAMRPPGTRFVVDRPNIVFERTSVDCPSAQLVSHATLDIMENGQTPIAVSAGTGARANIARGALDEAIEAELLGAREVPIDTPSIMAAAGKAKVPFVTLRGSQTAALKALRLPGVSEQAVAATLAAGQVAAVTKLPVEIGAMSHVAWWAVDPVTGNTIGRADDGAGQEMVEYPLSTANGLSTITNVMEFGFSVEGCAWKAADAGLRGGSFDLPACEQKVICEMAVNMAQDGGYSILGILYGEPADAVELAELMQGDFETITKTISDKDPSVSNAVCDGGD